jgi:transcriptional antiterminator RfaH
MSIVPKEPSLFPEDLFDLSLAGGPPARWWVLYTRARAEKALGRQLLGRKTSFFLPLHESRRRARGRVVATQIPLFPGYVFLYGDAEARLHALMTNLVSRCLWVEDQAQLQDDLCRVYRLIESGAPLTPEQRLQPGSLVEITCGALAGTRGKVLSCGKQLRFTVEIQFLQQGVSLDVESWMLRPVPAEHPAVTARQG